MGAFGLTGAGEFSNAVTDCGLWVNGVGLGTRYEGTYTPGTWPVVGNCSTWTDWQKWNSTMKASIQQFALASMDALQVGGQLWKFDNSYEFISVELVLLDVEDRKLLGHWRRRVTAMVVPTRSSERLDAHRSSDCIRNLRKSRPMESSSSTMANRRCGCRPDCCGRYFIVRLATCFDQ